MNVNTEKSQPYRMRTGLFTALVFLLLTASSIALLQVWAPLGAAWPVFAIMCVVLSYNYAMALSTQCAGLMLRQPLIETNSLQPPYSFAKVVVVVPCLLSSEEIVDDLLKALAANCRSSPGVNCGFVLLADLPDTNLREANGQASVHEAELLQRAVIGIDRLNDEIGMRFGLLLRPRVWVPAELLWMGKERKRGKIEAFNRYLLNPSDCAFNLVHCDTELLRDVLYVLTLDADSLLPEGALRSLVSLIDDPTNAKFAIIQPALRPKLGEPKNLYQWVTSSPFPPLTILQNVFGRSKFVGKGIYRVEEFHASVAGRIPDNVVLSHDVLESCLMPVGSVDEVFLVESHPSSLSEAMARLHRWYRGDWQNLAWAFPSNVRRTVSGFQQVELANIGFFGAWTISDLVVRDLHAPCLLALMFAAFYLPDDLAVLGLLLACEFSLMVITLAAKQSRAEAPATITELLRTLTGSFYYWMTLPVHAWVSVDAAARAIWRMLVSRRHRLEWTASAEYRAKRTSHARLPLMTPQVCAAASSMFVAVSQNSGTALLLSLLWLSQPIVQLWLERTPCQSLGEQAG
ncbi:hypothetical protein [Ottowia sp.]|uniref:hypothetical protein n=1 Tax=Ottowia sp. TaxID=1898956 RepID=UPI0025E547C7|nr:hypothetical protein [Ottowia sp.]MBK6616099.1 hypothetical protein [Ottowia sp.]